MPYLRLLAWIVMFAIPIQGLAAASMLFCGQGTAHHGQAAAHEHPAGTPAHDHEQQPNLQLVQDTAAVQLSDGKSAPDLTHKCSVCASCCHAVGIPPTALMIEPDVPSRADPIGLTMAVHSRPLLVPDKPPRA
jgi:hypothetical protein